MVKLPNSTKSNQMEPAEPGTVLLLQVPRTNDKKELAAEQMFASLHGLLTIPSTKMWQAPKREVLSFEIAVIKQRIGFYVWVPDYLKGFVEEQIYAQYPTVQISEVEDYAKVEQNWPTTLYSELSLSGNEALPIKTFQNFEVDPLAAITGTLAKFGPDEEAWIQLLVRPAAHNWHTKSERYVASVRGGQSNTASAWLQAFMNPSQQAKPEAPKLTEYDTARASAAEEKSHKLAFEASIKIVYRGNLPAPQAKLQMQSIVASYKQFNTTYLNGFNPRRISEDAALAGLYKWRGFNKRGYALNIEEVATLYHLPHTNVETPYILWAISQTAEPPANLPTVTGTPNGDISPVGSTNFRGRNTAFGLPRGDRGRHLYIIGQTGVGKSGLLELLTISDIYSPYGFAVIDPHGDYALNTLQRIPAERANDVIYFNPADTDYPIAFNPMEVTDPKLKTHTASELIGVLKRMFDSWGPRLEYILRYSLLALLDYPNSTMLDITRMLTDKRFRKEVLTHVEDPVVRNFWQVEFASWNDKFAAEAVAPVLNKVGAFTANPLVRNIIGQPKSSFNIRQIMDERKILIVNLSRGLVGEDNASLLGALLVTKVQLAAMSRADIPAAQREPFYLYVDEFQNFATDSFATILSEARKYGLNLTVANQYIAQMPVEVKDAVFGNVGSIVAFRMSADDARTMLKYFEPRFEEHDLVHMHNRYCVISMTIDGEKMAGFSAVTLNLPAGQADYTAHIVENSRRSYSVSREFVDRYIHEHYLVNGQPTASGHPPAQKPAPPAQKPAATPPTGPAQAAEPAPKIPVDATPSQTDAPAAAAQEEPAGPTKKRRRRRRRKASGETSPEPVQSTKPVSKAEPKPTQSAQAKSAKKPAPKNTGELTGEGTIHLK